MTREEGGDQSARLDLTVRAVEWIEEQRKADREQLTLGLGQVERLGQLARELASRTEVLEDERGQVRSLGSRVHALEDAASGMRELAADLKQSLDALQKQSEHQTMLRSAEIEHDRRGISELTQQVSDIRRQNESLQNRIQAVSEELRRDRTAADQVPLALDGLSRQIASLVSRTQQLEDYRRRIDDQAAALSQGSEQVRGDVMKLDNWQRLADVRWNRLNTELQDQAQAIKHQVEEQAKPVQQIGRLVKQVQEDSAGIAGQVQDLRKRIDDQFVANEKVAGQIGTLREGIARIEVALEAQKRQADENAASIARLDEALQRAAAASVELGRKLEAQDARIDAVGSQVRVIESLRGRDEQTLAALQQQVRDLRLSFAEELAAVRDGCAAEIRLLNQRVAAIGLVGLREREKALSLAQQEVEEWTGLVREDRREDRRPNGAGDAGSIEKRRSEPAS